MQPSNKWNIYYDRWLLIAAVALIALGLLMVTSASMVISDRRYHYPFHFLFRQTSYLIVGVFVAVIIARIKIDIWQKISGYLLVIGFALLVLVLVPGIGHSVNGSRRWLGLGPIGVQVSELIKLFIILYLAGYLVRRKKEVQQQLSGLIKPLVVLVLISGLLLMEPDFGATVVVMATALGMLFLGGVRLRYFLLLFVIVAVGLAFLAVSEPYRLVRLTTFLHPWAKQFDSGYQLTQSLIAFGRGGFWGVGLGNSVQKLFYLPEAHTDFLFAVLAEELGLVGELVVIGLFVLLVGRIFYIGKLAINNGHQFAAYVAWGIGFWLGLQTMINIGVNAGLLPTKGLTLPFMSYGGSSLVVNCLLLGILFRITYEASDLRPR